MPSDGSGTRPTRRQEVSTGSDSDRVLRHQESARRAATLHAARPRSPLVASLPTTDPVPGMQSMEVVCPGWLSWVTYASRFMIICSCQLPRQPFSHRHPGMPAFPVSPRAALRPGRLVRFLIRENRLLSEWSHSGVPGSRHGFAYAAPESGRPPGTVR